MRVTDPAPKRIKDCCRASLRAATKSGVELNPQAQLAKEDERFNYLLGGVWQNTMSDEVWKRVQAARREVW